MLINAELIQDSLRRFDFDPKKISETLGEKKRARWLTAREAMRKAGPRRLESLSDIQLS